MRLPLLASVLLVPLGASAAELLKFAADNDLTAEELTPETNA